MEQYSLLSLHYMTYNNYIVITWYNSSLWLASTPWQVHNLSKSKLH